MSPAALLLFFGIILLVFVGSGVLGLLQSRRRRNIEARSKREPSSQMPGNLREPARRSQLRRRRWG